MLQEWRYHFENHILERGYDLYYHGRVSLKRQEMGKFQFEVQSQKKYTIMVSIQKNHVHELKCQCPYAKEGHLCKHEAACLIYLENDFKHPSSILEDAKSLVAKIPEDLKNQILTKVLMEQQDLFDQVKSEFQMEVLPFDEQSARLNQIFIQYGCHQDDVYTFENELHQFIETIVLSQINNGQEKQALAHLKHLLSRLKHLMTEENMEAPSKEIENKALEALGLLLDSPEYTKNIFEFLCADFTHEAYLDFIFDYFRCEPYLSVKLHLINRCISKAQQFEAWAKDYYVERYYLKKTQVLYDLNDKIQLEQLKKEYWHYPKIREFWIEEAIMKKQYTTAISMLHESQQIDISQPHLLLKYERMLVDLYDLTDDKRYLAGLRKLLFESDPGDFDDYLRYKAELSKEQWHIEREALLKVGMDETRFLDILFSEGLYEQLLSRIASTSNLYYLERNISPLETNCIDLLADVYGAIAKQQAKVAKKREDYQMIASLLNNMANYPSGKEKAKELIQLFIQIYARKKAFVDELKKCFVNF